LYPLATTSTPTLQFSSTYPAVWSSCPGTTRHAARAGCSPLAADGPLSGSPGSKTNKATHVKQSHTLATVEFKMLYKYIFSQHEYALHG